MQDVGRFRLLGANLDQIPGWCAELHFAAEIGDVAWALRNLDQKMKNATKQSTTLCSSSLHA